jgi:C4-dicarboxylate-specific signal transduction histidine kinase
MEFTMSAKFAIDTDFGLQFFGKMTASISHEIKNVLAIVKENAGLLEDLARMAGRGAEIEPQRLVKMSQVVMKQVDRADAIVKIMNRLAHSVDESEKTVDLNDMLTLLAALSHRFASMRGVALTLKLEDRPVELRTAPFFLLNLLWLSLNFAIAAAGEDKRLELAPQKTGDTIHVFFKGLGGLAETPVQPFTAEHENDLCELLGAELEVRLGKQEMVLRFAAQGNH